MHLVPILEEIQMHQAWYPLFYSYSPISHLFFIAIRFWIKRRGFFSRTPRPPRRNVSWDGRNLSCFWENGSSETPAVWGSWGAAETTHQSHAPDVPWPVKRNTTGTREREGSPAETKNGGEYHTLYLIACSQTFLFLFFFLATFPQPHPHALAVSHSHSTLTLPFHFGQIFGLGEG